jgi:hypothetical protein
MNFDEKLSKTPIESGEGRSRPHQVLEKKKEVKWKTSPLVAHAARIAKPTLCVVAILVGVVAANEVVSGGFKKGIQFNAKEKESRKFKNSREKFRTRKTFFSKRSRCY